MYIIFEYAVCLMLVAMAVTLVFAFCIVWIVVEEKATELGWLAREIARHAGPLGARTKGTLRSGLSAIGFCLRQAEHEEVTESRRLQCSR